MEKSLGSPGSGHHVEPEDVSKKIDEPCTKVINKQPGSSGNRKLNQESGGSSSLMLPEESKKVALQLPTQVTHQQPGSIGVKEQHQETKSSGSLVVPATETAPVGFVFGVISPGMVVNFSQEAMVNQPAVEVIADVNKNPLGTPRVLVEASSNTTRREWMSSATILENSPLPQINLEQVTTKTGEEEENNVYEIGGKLYVYVKAKIVEAEQTEDKQNEEEEVEEKVDAGKGEDAKKQRLPAEWKIIGCGLLKLKERKKKPRKPRLILREGCGYHPSIGKLIKRGDIILNSNIWSTMILKKAERTDGSVIPDQIHFSAILNGETRSLQFKRTLEGDSDAMFDQIESRIHALRQQEMYGDEGSDSDDEEETDGDESDDDDSGEAEPDEASPSSPKKQKRE